MALRKERGQTGIVRRIIVPFVSLFAFFLDCTVLLGIQLAAKFGLGDHTIKEQKLLNYTKRQFIVILTSILRIVAPCKVQITTDSDSIEDGTFYLDRSTGRLRADLSTKSVTICNHQIYTDWVFLWWLAYTGDIASNIFIMLKKSLRKIPVLGYGMENFNFIFMNRKWAQDRINMSNHLNVISADSRGCGPLAGKKPISVNPDGEEIWDTNTIDKRNINWPYNLILFPEGTNLSAHTRKVNEAYAEKIGRTPYRHVLMPRSTGLRFCLLKLRNTVDVVYDITIGYSGIHHTEYGQDAYSLKNIFLRGKYPKLVSIYVRAIKIDDIPIDDELDFTEWLYKLWKEKDDLMEYFYEHGTFANKKKNQKSLTADCSIKNYEFFPVFIVPIVFVYVFYWFWKHIL
ncbi:2-acyl-1-lysophosphatidylinositol acyltransferase [Nakaseomyces bracarensis]|uniref:2-acyl-1-lysophosphatidylinositol acyltransferase n=1 Tax=Nakaseomyces bracarensis TaxID=273131 RepID=A0ABR4NVT8_9SACH